MYRLLPCGEPGKRGLELHRGLEIHRPFAGCPRKNEIRLRDGPGGFDHGLDFREERRREPGQRIVQCPSSRLRIQASIAATLMPWPKAGLKRQTASATGSSPFGKVVSKSK